MHCPQHHIPVHCLPQCRVRKAFKLNAKKKDSDSRAAAQIVDTAIKMMDHVADLVPSAVPRSVARGGVVVAGTVLTFGLLKKVLSGIITLSIISGVAYWWLSKEEQSVDVEVSATTPTPTSTRAKKMLNLDDPLAQVGDIIRKYKK